MRQATIERKTRETEIKVTVGLDGTGVSSIKTGIGFFEHMVEQLARHGLIDIDLNATGDLHIDDHHTVEDCGIVLGKAVAKALGEPRAFAVTVRPMSRWTRRL
jgi:imidazoleglycerol-phosphate dehydratase